MAEKDNGYCFDCKKFYEETNSAHQECPEGHDLLHPHRCNVCKKMMGYWQNDDDYCGAEFIVCRECTEGQEFEGKNK